MWFPDANRQEQSLYALTELLEQLYSKFTDNQSFNYFESVIKSPRPGPSL